MASRLNAVDDRRWEPPSEPHCRALEEFYEAFLEVVLGPEACEAGAPDCLV